MKYESLIAIKKTGILRNIPNAEIQTKVTRELSDHCLSMS
jgi:hypothetical protein